MTRLRGEGGRTHDVLSPAMRPLCCVALFVTQVCSLSVRHEQRTPAENGPKNTRQKVRAQPIGISAAPTFTNGQARGRGKEWPLADDKRRAQFLFPPFPILIIRLQKMEISILAFGDGTHARDAR
jgi:hypothetical protein